MAGSNASCIGNDQLSHRGIENIAPDREVKLGWVRTYEIPIEHIHATMVQHLTFLVHVY